MSSRVELRISATGIPKMDVMSQSDPFCVVYLQDHRGEFHLIGRTETKQDQPNPQFITPILLSYKFEEVQKLKFELWDEDTPVKADFIGSMEITLGKIMGSRGCAHTAAIGAKSAKITVQGTEVAGTMDGLAISLSCLKLAKKDFFGSSDPFLRISRTVGDGSRIAAWESPVIRNNLNPIWPPFEIPVQVVCNGDYNALLVFQCFDWNASSPPELIGEMSITLNELIGLNVQHGSVPSPLQPQPQGASAGCQIIGQLSGAKQFPLVDPKKAAKKPGSTSGTLVIKSGSIIRRPTVLDYIRGGVEINLIAAVDFTGSNGDPRTPQSLHYMNPKGGVLNAYAGALAAVGNVLLPYDADGCVPLYGFGGSINNVTSHCFAMTFNEAAPEVIGVNGMLECYQQSFQYVGLSFPTLLAPVLRRAAESAAADLTAGRLKYTVLLLITDGQANDMDDSVRAIVEASSLPLSIVIVGVGAADFSGMVALDGDEKRLSWGGRSALRDIVQFVPMNKHAAAGPLSAEKLAEDVLAEIPAQLCGYFASRGIAPGPALQPVALPPAVTLPSSPPAVPYGSSNTNNGGNNGGHLQPFPSFYVPQPPLLGGGGSGSGSRTPPFL